MNYRSSIKIIIIYIINRLFSQINLKFLYHSCNSDKEKKMGFFFNKFRSVSISLYTFPEAVAHICIDMLVHGGFG